MCDVNVLQFIGLPLLDCTTVCVSSGGDRCEGHNHSNSLNEHRSHQESWSPITPCVNKVTFDRNMGFVTRNSSSLSLPINLPVDTSDPDQYIKLAIAVKTSGHPNYKGLRVPLRSTFNLEYLKQEIKDHHDQILLDYLTFGFPLGIDPSLEICCNATENHTSAKQFPEGIDEYITIEREFGALLGSFNCIPHPDFTWSPLMTRPKGSGRRVILDLNYGDFSGNKATCKETYDGTPFTLKLPKLDDLVPTLMDLGDNAHLLICTTLLTLFI